MMYKIMSLNSVMSAFAMSALTLDGANKNDSSIPSCTRFKCTRTFWYCYLIFVLTSEHKQSLRKGVTSTRKFTYIRSTYKRECWNNDNGHNTINNTNTCNDMNINDTNNTLNNTITYNGSTYNSNTPSGTNNNYDNNEVTNTNCYYYY